MKCVILSLKLSLQTIIITFDFHVHVSQVPNGVGAILAAFQLGLYGIYYKSPTPKTVDENEKGTLEP